MEAMPPDPARPQEGASSVIDEGLVNSVVGSGTEEAGPSPIPGDSGVTLPVDIPLDPSKVDPSNPQERAAYMRAKAEVEIDPTVPFPQFLGSDIFGTATVEEKLNMLWNIECQTAQRVQAILDSHRNIEEMIKGATSSPMFKAILGG